MIRPSLTAVLVCTSLLGCTTAQTSNTARTATEQLLISNAVDQSLDKVDFRPFAGRSVFLDEKYIDCVDKAYVVGSIRHRILKVGGQMADKAENADVVLEPRSGGVGTTGSSSFVGIPSIVLPGMLTLPEVRFFTRTRQSGYAKLGLAAFDPKTRHVLGNGGVSVAQSDDTNSYLVGIGPFQSGSLKSELTRTTTGPAAIARDSMPASVAFARPPEHLEEAASEVKITSEEQVEDAANHVESTPFYPPVQK